MRLYAPKINLKKGTGFYMKDFIITTDSTADLPEEFIKEHDIKILTLPYTLDGVTYSYEHSMPVKEFYDKMRNGSMPTTSQVNPEEAKNAFESFIEKYDVDILHICFSSGMSGSYNNCLIAADDLSESHPDNRIVVFDTLGATLGEGLFVYKAVKMKDEGHSLDDIYGWLKENQLHVVHNFTVDDLFHLHRGGRLSKAAAIVGTMISLKPVLHVDDEGHLVMVGKTRGRKKSLIALVECMEKQIGTYHGKNDTVFISHGDCEEDAQYVADLIKERLGLTSFVINYIGPTIGAHSGPGTVALFYLGDYR
jgi:DegV family protein with EDD domain